jgi:hypothetical protein
VKKKKKKGTKMIPPPGFQIDPFRRGRFTTGQSNQLFIARPHACRKKERGKWRKLKRRLIII